MTDKSTTDQENEERREEQHDAGSPPRAPKRGVRRALATVALVAAAAVALTFLLRHQEVTLTLVVEKGRVVSPIRVADVKIHSRDGDHVRAHIHLTDLGEDFGRHVRKLELEKGDYVIETRVEHSDSSVRHTKKKITLEKDVRLTVTLR